MTDDESWVDDIEDSTEEEVAAHAAEPTPAEVAPNAMTIDEAAERKPTWRILLWGDPGKGKTHFSYTMPEPVCIIDTEQKADVIAHKFDREVYLWQPSNYDEAREALAEAIEVLDMKNGEDNGRGTIVVDSMSVVWGWSQSKYVDEFYPGKDVEDVELSTGFGSGQSDWKKIKEYHNANFRQVMLDTEYHLCWTAMREDDYEAIIEEGANRADKPAGEKENPYKASDIIRIAENSEGKPVGLLQKSALVSPKNYYKGLEFPTFEKHRKISREIEEMETEGDVDPAQLSYDVDLVEGKPTATDQ